MQNIKIQLLFILPFLLVACDMQKYPEPVNSNQRELLIYSGMTMLQPLQEISTLIEKEENCRIKITYGGSGHILKSVEVNQIGDLFFPVEYIETQPLVMGLLSYSQHPELARKIMQLASSAVGQNIFRKYGFLD